LAKYTTLVTYAQPGSFDNRILLIRDFFHIGMVSPPLNPGSWQKTG
jgi:hypothetical protein